MRNRDPGPGPSGVVTALRPDADHRLADGVVVETTLVARLLGLRVLRIDGTVLLSPASVVEGTAPPTPMSVTATAEPVVGNGNLALARRLLEENGERLRRLH